MIPVLTADQIRAADEYTIRTEPIASIDLMERAAYAFANKFEELSEKGRLIQIFCGIGNNGGDGLAIARLLINLGKKPEVFVIGDKLSGSADFKFNLEALTGLTPIRFIKNLEDIPLLDASHTLIDALFGTGLKRPISGLFATLIESMNQCGSPIFSVDLASGLRSDSGPEGICIEPKVTISFEVPKLVFFLPELHRLVGEWYLVKIGLDQDFLATQKTDNYLTESIDVGSILKPRSRFMHKGLAGNLILIGGSRGKIGAVLLAAHAAMRSGVGLLFIHAPRVGYPILQTGIPEAMVLDDTAENHISDLTRIPDNQVVAIGPGLGTHPNTVQTFSDYLEFRKAPLVIDADALNILAENGSLLKEIPENSILTPHPGEFKRLVGEWSDDLEKLKLLSTFCQTWKVNMVLKGAYSAVCDREGIIYFNPTGNPGMATAGSGDVLTGIIGALLAQGNRPIDALRLGVYLHGLAGDLASKKLGEISVMASDIIDHLPDGFQSFIKIGNQTGKNNTQDL